MTIIKESLPGVSDDPPPYEADAVRDAFSYTYQSDSLLRPTTSSHTEASLSSSSLPRPSSSSASVNNGNNSSLCSIENNTTRTPAQSWEPTETDLTLSMLPSVDFFLRIKQRLARSGTNIDPTIPSFSRAPNPMRKYSSFESFICLNKGRFAGDGFEAVYPGNIFVDHDVSSADWQRFLEDICVASQLIPTPSANMLKASRYTGAFTFLICKGLDNLRKKQEVGVHNVVETWQDKFFAPRRLDVYLYRPASQERVTSIKPDPDTSNDSTGPSPNNSGSDSTTTTPHPDKASLSDSASFETSSINGDESAATRARAERTKEMEKQKKFQKSVEKAKAKGRLVLKVAPLAEPCVMTSI